MIKHNAELEAEILDRFRYRDFQAARHELAVAAGFSIANFDIAYANMKEPAARAAYERLTGLSMKPLVLVDGEYSASLDGLTLAGERLVEIKCPLKGRESSLWKAIEATPRALPEHYQWQVQHQLMVSKADVADVFVFDGSEGMVFSCGARSWDVAAH